MVGLPGQKLIDPRFQSHTAQMIAGTFRSTGRLTRLGNPQGVRDVTTGRTTFPVPYIVYEGAARVQSRGGGTNATVGDRALTIGSYLLVLPADAEPARVNDVWETLSCPDTPWLVGRTFVVVETPAADIAWQRSYGCDLIEPTNGG